MNYYASKKTELVNGVEYEKVGDLALNGRLAGCVFCGVTAHGTATEMTYMRLVQGKNQHVSVMVRGSDDFLIREYK